MPEYRTILSPVDFSEASTKAFDTAVDFAKRLGAEVHVLHAYQFPASEMPTGIMDEYPEDLSATVEQRLQAKLDDLVKAKVDSGVTIHTALTEGVPYLEIVRAAKEIGADLIVIGTHGRTGLAHLLLGSVAERVLRMAEVPVLTVRQH